MTALTGKTVLRLAPGLACSYQGRSAVLSAAGSIRRYDGNATLLLRRMLPLIDGHRSLDTVADEVGGDRLRPAVLQLGHRLVIDGLLLEAEQGEQDRADARLLGSPVVPEGTGVHRHITTTRVVGEPDEVAAVAQLAPPHWQVTATSLSEITGVATPDGVCTVVWVTDPHDEKLAEWNETAYHNGQPWLPISHFDGQVAVVGPHVYPKESPCFECYRRRRAARHPLGPDYLDLRPLDPAPLTSKALTTVLAGIAVTMLHDWEVRANPYVPGALRTVTFDRGLQVGTELVLRVPRCASCRPGAAVARPTLWSEYFATEDTAARP
ncbi:TOMM precursor leader peptide-binding protein [Streptomyces sp. DSM 44915]|uniref:TOMM leader peptide-binding protein n=1 Tax=Streptomyces chisholmiae TaxID=3075540 RepID=A0ABU2JP54_9ACTN|nr:TOMM precursor leader peptide-binding protein [Streptomyces sp. DSM 44915]MDT0266511.1 TOMM precursor leader peptide-binding protein [Streptomyces sp. DSM 44915]